MEEHLTELARNTLFQAVAEVCARDADLAAAVNRYGRPPLWRRRPGCSTKQRPFPGA